MKLEKRRVYTAACKREAVRLVTDHGYGTMALGRRQPDAGLIHHRDRGSQYASHAYRGLLAD